MFPETVLAEGSVVERLRRDPRVKLDPFLAHAGFIYQPEPRMLLANIYRQYLDIARDCGLPMICLSPTWRANPERVAAAGMAGRDVNGDAVRFLRGIREDYPETRVFLGGLIGCRGDAYRPREALPAAEAAAFHRPQLDALARAGVDFLLASTLPAAAEALGIARAMAGAGLPYLLSFIVAANGTLLDGTPIARAMAEIDGAVAPAPEGYLVNCVHTSVFASAMSFVEDGRRVLGLQANTSRKSPAELEGLAQIDTEEPQVFAQGMAELRRRFRLRILGGCCGTDHRHIRALAVQLLGNPS